MSPLSIAFRLALLVAFLVAATWGVHLVREALDMRIMPENEQQVHRAIMLGMVAYVGFLALPFVPGAEIGIALLAAFGPPIAPLIYAATVAAMMLAYTIGRFLPVAMLARILSALRLRRAADLVSRAAALPPDERLTLLTEGQPSGRLHTALRFRYLAMALAVNTPGNSILGGGGGIMMVAGMSGLFSPLSTFATIALAVSPVPLAVLFLGVKLG